MKTHIHRAVRSLVLLIAFAFPVLAQPLDENKPETWKTAQDVLTFEKLFQERVDAFEANPLSQEHYSQERSAFFMSWIEKCPYIIKMDERIIGPFMDDKSNQISRLLFRAFLGGKTVYLTKEKEKPEEHAANLAGFKSITKVYRAIKKKAPTLKHSYAERLVKIEDEGELGSHVHELEKIE